MKPYLIALLLMLNWQWVGAEPPGCYLVQPDGIKLIIGTNSSIELVPVILNTKGNGDSLTKNKHHSEIYWIGRYEVTDNDFFEITEGVPSDYNFPVSGVTWVDAMRYCFMLTDKAKKDGLIPANMTFRLPTITEWENALCGGINNDDNNEPFYITQHDGNFAAENLTNKNPFVNIKRGGSFQPNTLGLFDMLGNVSEWCLDVNQEENVYKGTLLGGGWNETRSMCIFSKMKEKSSCHVATLSSGFRIVLAKEDKSIIDTQKVYEKLILLLEQHQLKERRYPAYRPVDKPAPAGHDAIK